MLRTSDAAADRNVTALWRVDSANGDPHQLTTGPADSAPTWSPDGSSVAFVRAGDGPGQVWLLPAKGGEPRSLTDLPLGAGRPVWSPDGSRIAFTAPVDLLATPGESEEDRADRGHAPLVAERLDYQADGVGIRRGVRMHLHVVEVATGQCRQVTDGDWDAGEPAWSPDGEQLAFAAATAPDRDLVFSAPVHVVAADGTTDPEPVAFTDSIALALSWTPDGAGLLAVAFEPDKGLAGHAHLIRIPLGGGDPVDLAASLDRNVMPGGPGYPGAVPQVAGDGRTVVFCVRDRGCTHLYSVPLEGGEPQPLVSEPGTVVSGASVAGSRIAVVISTPTSFGEVAVVDLAGAGVEVRTGYGPDPAEIELFAREERAFTISDGTAVQGWLMRDPEAPTPQPLLLDIHGGPAQRVERRRRLDPPLPPGTRGARLGGAAAQPARQRRLRRGLLPGCSRATGASRTRRTSSSRSTHSSPKGIADPERLAVTGYSYGGYMTCYLTSRDERFAAAVAGGVVSDLVSMGGTSDDAHLLSRYELGGEPWAVGDRYAAMSPLSRVDERRHADARLPRRGRPPVPGRPGAAVVHGATRARRADDARPLPGRSAPVHPRRAALAPSSTSTVASSTGWSSMPAHAARVDGRARRRALAPPAGRPGGAAPRPRRRSSAFSASAPERTRPVVAAYGLLNKTTGVEATDDSVFQIGSMTKVWTATVVMQLVDEGKLDLDAPIVDVLPELRLADPDVAAASRCATCSPTRAASTATSSPTRGAATTASRSTSPCWREAAQNHPLGGHLVVLQLRLLLAGRVIEKLTGEHMGRRRCASGSSHRSA